MDVVINLLRDKNHHLKKFSDLNQEELVRFVVGDYERLETFYQARETILNIIRCIDELIDAETATVDLAISESERALIKALMQEKNDLVHRILSQDLQILSVIESAKSSLIKELRQVQMGRKAIRRYKSGGTSANLDEEA